MSSGYVSLLNAKIARDTQRHTQNDYIVLFKAMAATHFFHLIFIFLFFYWRLFS